MRAATALAAAGALVMSSGLVLLTAQMAAANGQPGNNGTVKVGDTGDIDEQRPENDPHLPCTFNIQWFNYDAGWANITSSVGFELQEPTTGNDGVTMSLVSGDTSPVIVSNGGKPGAGDGYDALKTYTLSFTGPQHEQQGYHVKITVTTPHSQGAESKHKVFWVGPCATQDRPVPAAPVPSAPDCDTDGSLDLPSNGDGLLWTISQDSGTVDNSDPYGPGVYDVTVTSTTVPFVGGGMTRTFNNIAVLAATGNCGGGGGTPTPPSLQDVAPAVTFTDPDCANLRGARWAGTLESIVDYKVFGEPGLGETVLVEAVIKPGLTGTHKFAAGATTAFSHTFPTLDELDCVLGEETIVPTPKPDKPEPKPDKEPTVKGVQAVAPPAAAPTAVAAGIGDTASSPLQTIAQMLVAGGMLLLMAGAWIGLGRREFGTHEA